MEYSRPHARRHHLYYVFNLFFERFRLLGRYFQYCYSVVLLYSLFINMMWADSKLCQELCCIAVFCPWFPNASILVTLHPC